MLTVESATLATLGRWGIRNLGELAALPETALVSRIGQQGKRLQLLAVGREDHLLVPQDPSFVLSEHVELDGPLESLEPLLFILSPMLEILLRQAIQHAYAVRSVTITLDLEKHMTPKSPLSEHKQQTARRILISGSSGLIGRAVIASRGRAGDFVVPLVRAEGTADALLWDPGSGRLDPSLVSGFDTVIHLAGEPVVGLWTTSRRRRIMESRVLGTAQLATALASAAVPPRLFLSASGINFYGSRGNTVLDETAPAGQGFLAEVCKAWEAASKPLIHRSRSSVFSKIGKHLSIFARSWNSSTTVLSGSVHPHPRLAPSLPRAMAAQRQVWTWRDISPRPLFLRTSIRTVLAFRGRIA